MTRFVMTERGSKILKARGLTLRCERCGELLEVGDECFSQRRTKSVSKRYHLDCWKQLFIEV